jgi:predicted CXXCH cytochrome family protein
MMVHTGGVVPPPNLFAAIGQPLPPIPTDKLGNPLVTWDQVQDIVANFEGQGSFLMANGNLLEQNGATVKPMPARCNKCHSTGFNSSGTAYGDPAIQGSWALGSSAFDGTPSALSNGMFGLNGVQCEQCHGPGRTMKKSPELTSADKGLCRDCHSTSDTDHRVTFSATAIKDSVTPNGRPGFSNHHPQGDEYRVSPHKDYGCTICHDPHKSVWHNQGGVKFANNFPDPGNMCMQCHRERIRGAMGQLGLACADCHMPEISASGARTAHIFKINDTPLAAKDNTYQASGKTYWNIAANGQSSLTLDLVCTKCHSNMTLKMMSNAAPFIHRSFGMIDLTVNGNDSISSVTRNTNVSVNFSILAGAKKGLKSMVYVMANGPKGWSSWNGKAWVTGQVPWYKNVALNDVPATNVVNGKLAPGNYAYWVVVYPSDGTQNVGVVPVVVR